MRLEPLADRDAIEARHVDVEEDEVGFLGRDRVERLDAVLGLAHVVPQVSETALQELPVRLLVVYDENPRPAWRGGILGHTPPAGSGPSPNAMSVPRVAPPLARAAAGSGLEGRGSSARTFGG